MNPKVYLLLKDDVDKESGYFLWKNIAPPFIVEHKSVLYRLVYSKKRHDQGGDLIHTIYYYIRYKPYTISDMPPLLSSI